jgi:hypothetical protein
VTPPSRSGLNKGPTTCPPTPRKPANEQECPPSPRKPTDEQAGEDIPWNHTLMSWAAYQIANKYPYSTMFERFATLEHSHTL